MLPFIHQARVVAIAKLIAAYPGCTTDELMQKLKATLWTESTLRRYLDLALKNGVIERREKGGWVPNGRPPFIFFLARNVKLDAEGVVFDD